MNLSSKKGKGEGRSLSLKGITSFAENHSQSILGLGIDLVSPERISQLWKRYGERFIRKILSPEELLTFRQAPDVVSRLTQLWGIKEAVYKALPDNPFGFYPSKIAARLEGRRWKIKLRGPYARLALDIEINIHNHKGTRLVMAIAHDK